MRSGADSSPGVFGRATALLAVVACFGVSDARAVTLMVNGDTPSVRYQRWVDDMLVPTPNIVVTLHLVADETAGLAACDHGGSSCIWYGPPATIVLQHFRAPHEWRREAARVARDALYHEVGHLIAAYLTPADQRAFLAILGDSRPWVSPSNSPHEQFPEVVTICASPPSVRRTFWQSPIRRYVAAYGLVMTESQLAASCALLRRLPSNVA